MVNQRQTILQIVPRLPGANDGVGDYARTLAQRLSERWNAETVFATADSALLQKDFAHAILHYVNYGYQKRGVPRALLSILREVRARCAGRFLTIFHELYAAGRAPWESAFWLRPFQMQIAKSIAQMSDAAIVSSETMLRQLRDLAPRANVSVHPVFSNFGEPSLSPDQLVNRSPHCWAICGGTVLIQRSLRSFRAIVNRIPEDFAVHELFVLGGEANEDIRVMIVDLDNVRVEYRPEIDTAEASQILSSCSFAWLDYFHRPDVPTDVILKSSAFAALCAHGIVPIFPHRGNAISIGGDRLPGPFFVDAKCSQLPSHDDRPQTAIAIQNWYRCQTSSKQLAHGVADALGLTANR